MSEIVPLTPKQKNSLHDAVSNPITPPPFALTGNVNPKMRVFVVHFDGTQNDKDNVPDGSTATLVANSHDFMNTGEHLTSRYYSGVGTRTSTVRGLLESVTGMGAVNRAERAYADLCEQTKEWRKQDPECEVHVHVVGFSRGSGIGLHFMNLVHNRGIQQSAKSRKIQNDMGPGEVKTSAVLFDAVTTGNLNLSLTLPDSNVATLHVTAGGEERLTFPLTTLKDPNAPDELSMVKGIFLGGTQPESKPIGYQRLSEVSLDGARHSDVGGSYPQGGIRQVSAYLMGEFQRNLGLPVYARKPTFEEIEHMHANDSRFLINKIADPFQGEDHRIEKRQAAERTVIHRGQREWDGDAVVKCKLKDGDGTELGFVRYEHCKLRQKDWGAEARSLNSMVYATGSMAMEDDFVQLPTPESIKSFRTESGELLPKEAFEKTTEISFQLADKNTPADRLFHGMELVGDKAPHIQITDDGKMTYHGLRIPGEYEPARLLEMVQSATDNRITLCIEMEKTTPVFDAKQRPVSLKDSEKIGNFLGELSFQDDPWPAAVRDALYKLNDPHEVVTAKEAQMMKYRAMESMSTRLLQSYGEGQKKDPRGEFIVPGHEVDSVSFKSDVMAHRQAGFHLEIRRKDGSVIRHNDPGQSAEDYVFLTEMKSMRAAMHMLDDSLFRAGHLTARPIHQIFSKTKEIDLSHETMPAKNVMQLSEKQVERLNRNNDLMAAERMNLTTAKGEDVVITMKTPLAVRGIGMLQTLSAETTSARKKQHSPH